MSGHQASNNVANNITHNGGPDSESPQDSAGNAHPARDKEHFLKGRDISNVDLSWRLREPGSDISIDPRTGEPWLHPKRWGACNLGEFREEIEERTRNGQGCKAIAEALVEKGVDTSARAVAGQRAKWGIRQRAQRRMTEQGIANIRKAHQRRKENPPVDRVPAKAVRVLIMRKAEITRMTNEGMSAAQIAENLVSRGVVLKRGASDIESLRTKWGLVPDSQRNIELVREGHRNVARRLQRAQFESIAAELGIEDVKAWAQSKMNEESALEARREHAYRLMGHLRPKPVDPRTMRGIVDYWLKKQASKRPSHHGAEVEGVQASGQQPALTQPETPSQPGAADDSIDMADNVADLASEEDEDCEGDEDPDTPATAVKPEPSTRDVKLEHSESRPLHSIPANASSHHPPQLPNLPVPNNTTSPEVPGGLLYPQYSTGTNGPVQHHLDHTAPTHQYQPSWQNYGAPPTPFEPPFQGWAEPRILETTTATSSRRDAPSGPIAQPFLPRLPPVMAPPGEAEMMARYGLYPFATLGKPPQRYLTPSGTVTTEGYEYLPSAPALPKAPSPTPAGGGTSANQHQQHPGPPPAHYGTAPHQPPATHQLPPDTATAPPPPPPGGPPRGAPRNVPAPRVVVPPEEAEGHMACHTAIAKHYKAAFECMEYLEARSGAVPLSESLTGLPPSLKDVEGAKARLREAVGVMLTYL